MRSILSLLLTRARHCPPRSLFPLRPAPQAALAPSGGSSRPTTIVVELDWSDTIEDPSGVVSYEFWTTSNQARPY